MLLLQLQGAGSFSLVEFQGNNVPLTYQDLLNSSGKDKSGYCKLTFCGHQAAKDDSSAKLSEAINSMFSWYHKAVSAGDRVTFSESGWFTRGWTLQELIAPMCLSSFLEKATCLEISICIRRETTREEDMVYSLFGIFGVHVPLIYGEDKEKAPKRLQKEIRETSEDTAATLGTNLAAPDPSVNYRKAL
ncbi:hypothetical protein EK21DRAFT_105092 [Setomelanomma holmii]|uniref:Uncharacterized protein n=1 Tax=Setomelanomma holmii TaxID=210430 RepID=A0A9P4GZ33_9PLEO|nr:hypothetical protein EK21DRAFT_105092 [Setomelanomma holmii]